MDPASLRYTESHEWVALEGDVAKVGISKFAVEQLTDLVYVELPEIGRKLSAKEAFGEVESVKAVSDLYSPLPGEVIEVNEAVKVDATKVTDDPFGSGWMIKLRVPPGTTTDGLLTREQYEKQITEEGQ